MASPLFDYLLTEEGFYRVYHVGIGFCIFTFIASQFIIAPYGRFANKSFGNLNSQFSLLIVIDYCICNIS